MTPGIKLEKKHINPDKSAYLELLDDGQVKAGESRDRTATFGSIDAAHAHFRPLATWPSEGYLHITRCLEDLMDERNDGL